MNDLNGPVVVGPLFIHSVLSPSAFLRCIIPTSCIGGGIVITFHNVSGGGGIIEEKTMVDGDAGLDFYL